jgi:hypothetical protein
VHCDETASSASLAAPSVEWATQMDALDVATLVWIAFESSSYAEGSKPAAGNKESLDLFGACLVSATAATTHTATSKSAIDFML